MYDRLPWLQDATITTYLTVIFNICASVYVQKLIYIISQTVHVVIKVNTTSSDSKLRALRNK